MGLPIEVQELFEREDEISITSIEARDDYSLLITFNSGEKKVYDMEGKLKGVFEILKDIKKFKKVFINESGNIAWDRDSNVNSKKVWNNRIDICKDAAYLKSKNI